MAFNSFCTGNSMKYASELDDDSFSKFIVKAPKPSYEIIDINSNQNTPNTPIEVKFRPTKEVYFNKENIPNWIEVKFFKIPLKKNNKLIALRVLNKCLTSKEPIMNEPYLIFYFHENGTDLLRLVPFFIDLSIQMKCDIISYDYMGFGCSSGKAKFDTFFSNKEISLETFAISYLKYKIENILLYGKGLGAMNAISLASNEKYQSCKGLILCMPIISDSIIDVEILKSIYCQTLIIQELDNNTHKLNNCILSLCQNIQNAKKWTPKRKSKDDNIFAAFEDNDNNCNDSGDVFYRHRRKFIIKLRDYIDYIYPDKDTMNSKLIKCSTVEGSTQVETNTYFSEQDNQINFETENKDKIALNNNNISNKIIENDNNIIMDELPIVIVDEDDY